jgi:hypothetical protein
MAIEYRCAHCNSPVIECITHFISVKGDLWKVPTKICTNEQCLGKQGATVVRKERREYPELRDTPTLRQQYLERGIELPGPAM